MTKQIQLTQGKVTIIDDDDYEKVSSHKWSAFLYDGNWRATSSIKNKTVKLSRFILGVTDSGVLVDHKNLDTLDNRKENLRLTNKQQNGRNRGAQKNNKSGYKGVCLDRGKYNAAIHVSGKHILIGRYNDIIEAAQAYDEAAKKLFGEYAKLNFS